jgi:hypothetical protein
LVTSCSGTVFYVKHVIRRKIDGSIEVTGRREEEVSSYWITLRKREVLEIEIEITR